jgi:hypothetical protein
MEEMHFHQVDVPPLQLMLTAARHFGLTPDEAWQAASDALDASGGDAYAAEYLDELSGVLARRIIAKERRTIADRRGIRRADERSLSDERGRG